MTKPHERDVIEFPASSAPQASEDQMALEFADAEKNRRRYVAGWGRWMSFDDGNWKPDETYETYEAIRQIVRARANRMARDGKSTSVARATRLSSAQTVSGVERLARADRRLAATTDQWDANPMILGVTGGFIDLASGECRASLPENYLTRGASVRPDADMATPLWTKFLAFVTQGDEEYAGFLQRMCGYCLTGSTKEQVLFFLYGSGGNGKGVFISVLSGILRGYSQAAAMETFVDTGRTSHPTDLAMLQGARLVTASETEKGRRWHESRIKQLTGGDEVPARFMRQDFFTFIPQFKLVISGNHKPSLRSVDEAMRRRMRLLPFVAKVPDELRDDELKDKIMEEAPGILAWMIEGCRTWQAVGLGTCARVEQATVEYLREEDALANWIAECCDTRANLFGRSSELFESWKRWAETSNEFVGTKKALGQALQQRGFEPDRKGQSRGFNGIEPRKGPPQ